MAKSKGPFLSAAILCEKVLQEQDGTLSAIRLIDRYTITTELTPEGQQLGVELPSELPEIELQVVLLVSFRSGDAKGTFELTLTITNPTGDAKPVGEPIPLTFLGEDQGMNLVPHLRMQLKQEGLYWIDVVLNNELVTRVPLRVVHQKAEIVPAPTETR